MLFGYCLNEGYISLQGPSYDVPLWEVMPGFQQKVLGASKRDQQWVSWQGEMRMGPSVGHPRAEQVLDFGTDLPKMDALSFRDPKTFRAGTLHAHINEWKLILSDNEMGDKVQNWIENGVHVPDFFERSDTGVPIGPPSRVFKNSPMCKDYVEFICASLEERVITGAVSVWGVVGQVEPPYLVSPLTIEPIKPRLCQNLIFLNKFCIDTPFSLDTLADVPRMVQKGGYLTKLDDKNGYDHILLTQRSKPWMGFQWGGVWFVNNTLPFGWKNSAYIYHSTNLQITSYLRAWMIPNLIYIDDRLIEQFRGKKVQELTCYDRSELACYATCEVLIRVGYCIGLSKSVLVPQFVILFLGVLVDTMKQAFLLTDRRKMKFASLRDGILAGGRTDLLLIQKLMGQCISFMAVIPAAKLYTSSMARAISTAMKKGDSEIFIDEDLRREIAHWRFIDEWDEYLPWFHEFHAMVEVVTDSSSYAWGCIATLDGDVWEQSDYWNACEMQWDISVKEARALINGIASFGEELKNCRVDALVDNQVLIAAWNRQSARAVHMEVALKDLASLLWKFNINLRLTYVPSAENQSDAASRRILLSDCRLSPMAWSRVEERFGGEKGHTLDLMALDSNAMLDREGKPLRHFTPYPTPKSSGVNVFSQEISAAENCYVFPPFKMVPAVIAFLRQERLTCTVVVPICDPIPNWQPLLQEMSWDCFILGPRGDKSVLEFPTKQGYRSDAVGLKRPLMVYRVLF